MRMPSFLVLVPSLALAPDLAGQGGQANANDALVAKHAAAHGVPESLVRRVIQIESRGNPRVVSKGNYGLMQIRLGTARAMGYSGGAQGLLDADTNMTYAVRYLAGAYRAARGNHAQAIRNYQRGYYYQAKQQGFSPYTLVSTQQVPVTQQAATPDPTLMQQEAARRAAIDQKIAIEQQQAMQREAALRARIEEQRAAEAAREAQRQAALQEKALRQQAIEQQRAAAREAALQERIVRQNAIQAQRAAQRQAALQQKIEREQARERSRIERQIRHEQIRQRPIQQRVEAPSSALAQAAAPALRSAAALAPAQAYSWYNPMRYFKHPSHRAYPYKPGER